MIGTSPFGVIVEEVCDRRWFVHFVPIAVVLEREKSLPDPMVREAEESKTRGRYVLTTMFRIK